MKRLGIKHAPRSSKFRARTVWLRMEVLEDRTLLSGNLLVDAFVSGDTNGTLMQFTQQGRLVSSVQVPIPPGSTDPGHQARGLSVDPSGNIDIYDGTFAPALATYAPAANSWSYQYFSGWDTVNNVSYGNVVADNDYIFASDMTILGDANGIMRFSSTGGTPVRFGQGTDFIQVAVGLDGLVYGLAGPFVQVFDPNTLTLLRTVNFENGPDSDIRSIAVEPSGTIITAGWDGYLAEYSATGQFLNSTHINDALMSVSLDIDGQVAVGGESGGLFLTTEALSSVQTIQTGASFVFVTFDHYIGTAPAPIQARVLPLTLTENTPFNGNVATFTDSDGNTAPSDYTATITWGDGQTASGTVAATTNGFSISGSHSYATPGNYQLSISIQDSDGASATATAQETVADAPLTAVAIPLPGAFDNQPVGGVVATFTDADPDPAVGDYTASISWGDGHSSAGMIGIGSQGGFTVSGGNTYTHEGTYTITISIKDFGGSTATVSSQILITDGVLNAAFVPITGTDGAAVSGVVATFTDADPNGHLSEYSADINWGDGHSSGGVMASDGHGGFTVSGTNTYAKEGSYTVSVAIYDNGGAAANVQGAATITDPPLNGAFVSFSGTDNTAAGGVVATFTDTDPDGHLGEYSATITWGDGHSSSGSIASDGNGGFTVSGTNVYALAGTYTVTVAILDVGGASLSVRGSATIIDPALNAQFVPITGIDGTPAGGVIARFTDPDPNGTLAQYSATVTWGDGHTGAGVIAADGHGGYTVSGSNAYATAGIYNVTIAVSDIGGTTTDVSGTATITDPRLNIQVDTISGTDGVAGGGVVATFTDPDPNGHLSEYSATINWGDGHSGTGLIAADGQGGFTVSGTNVYAVKGTFTVSVTIVDVGGTTSHASGTATITDPPLTATFVPFASTVAAPVSGVVATFKDADPNGNLAEYSAAIQWGDGTSSVASVAAVASGGFSVSGSHAYATEGSFTVTVAIADRGGASTTAHGTVHIGDAPITASASSFRAAANTSLQRVLATFSDPDPTRIAADFSASVSWGDGTTSAGVVAASIAGGFTVTGSHTFAKAGVYSLAVVIRDIGGASANPQASVVIRGPLAITGDTVNALPGSPFGAAVASFSGGDPTLGAGHYAATITWADGSSSAGAVTANPAGGFNVTVDRLAGAPGLSSFSVLVSDEEGDSASTTGTLNVEPPPQTLAIADNGSEEVFAVTRSGQLYAHQNATGWHYLGAFIESIGAVAEKSGDIVLFAVTTNHALFRLDSQSGWQMIGAPQTVLSVSVGLDASGLADAFVISSAADLLAYDVAAGWSLIGGRGSILSTGATANGEVLVVTADHRIAEYGAQSGWQLLSGSGFAQSVRAVTEPSGRLVVLASTAGGTLDWFTSSSGWMSLGVANSVQTVTAGTDARGYADAFILDEDGSLQEYRVATGLAAVPQGGPGTVQQVVSGDDGLAVVVNASDAVFLYSDALGWIPLTSAGFMNL